MKILSLFFKVFFMDIKLFAFTMVMVRVNRFLNQSELSFLSKTDGNLSLFLKSLICSR
jgi:hypothetical protein